MRGNRTVQDTPAQQEHRSKLTARSWKSGDGQAARAKKRAAALKENEARQLALVREEQSRLKAEFIARNARRAL